MLKSPDKTYTPKKAQKISIFAQYTYCFGILSKYTEKSPKNQHIREGLSACSKPGEVETILETSPIKSSERIQPPPNTMLQAKRALDHPSFQRSQDRSFSLIFNTINLYH